MTFNAYENSDVAHQASWRLLGDQPLIVHAPLLPNGAEHLDTKVEKGNRVSS